jgi:hypothetical protein
MRLSASSYCHVFALINCDLCIQDVSLAAHKLAVAVVERCADKLEPYVQKFLTSVMLENKRPESELQEDYHDIIYEIYRCAPQMLLAVIPNLTQELVVGSKLQDSCYLESARVQLYFETWFQCLSK